MRRCVKGQLSAVFKEAEQFRNLLLVAIDTQVLVLGHDSVKEIQALIGGRSTKQHIAAKRTFALTHYPQARLLRGLSPVADIGKAPYEDRNAHYEPEFHLADGVDEGFEYLIR
jgi:hypothetical protein